MLNYKRNAYTLNSSAKKIYNSEEAIKNLREIQRQSALNGLSEMTLEEINAEISAARLERKAREEQLHQ